MMPIIIGVIIGVIFIIFMIVTMWKIFQKANEKGYKSLIPIYNYIVLLNISGFASWQIILFLIPIVNIIYMFKMYIGLSKRFGKATGFGVMCTLFPYIGLPILAFSKAEYKGEIKEEKDVSILDVNNSGVPNESEKPEFSYGYEKEPTIVMDPISQDQIKNESNIDDIPKNIDETQSSSGTSSSEMLTATIPEPKKEEIRENNISNNNDLSIKMGVNNDNINTSVEKNTQPEIINEANDLEANIENNVNDINNNVDNNNLESTNLENNNNAPINDNSNLENKNDSDNEDFESVN